MTDMTSAYRAWRKQQLAEFQKAFGLTDTTPDLDDSMMKPSDEWKAAWAGATEASAKALTWYGDEARALAKHLPSGAQTQAVLASITVLSLDGGKRADTAIAAAHEEQKND